MSEQFVSVLPLHSALSVVLVLAVTVLVLYLARRQAHALIRSVTRNGQRVLQVAAQAVVQGERRLAARNRQVLLAIAKGYQERQVEREFERVQFALQRDMSNYPTMHHALTGQISRIEEDYQRSAHTPPTPPAWLEAIEAVARVQNSSDPAIKQILEDMRETLENACHQALLEYRAVSRRRHRGLQRLLPYWRRVEGSLRSLNDTLQTLQQRASAIDSQMEAYRKIRESDDDTARALSSSAFSRFLISTFVLVIATAAAVFNYDLLSRGMSALLDGSIGSVSSAGLAGAVITLLQIGMGMTILESAGITRMLPLLRGLDDLARTRLLTAATGVLLAMTALEASLAFSSAHTLLPALSPEGGEAPRLVGGLMLMLLGTVLPLVLALVAIPLEAFIASVRIALGAAGVLLLRGLAALLRLAGTLLQALGQGLLRVYDLIVFAPLWVEGLFSGTRGKRQAEQAPASADKVEQAS